MKKKTKAKTKTRKPERAKPRKKAASASKSAPGCICYVEIPAPNLAGARDFYQRVFKWKVKDSSMAGVSYAMFRTSGSLTGGLDPSKSAQDSGVLLYLEVKDIEGKLAEIRDAGGDVVTGKTEIGGGFGYFGIFRDPNGNRLGVWAQK